MVRGEGGGRATEALSYKRRGRLDVVADILDASRRGIGKTRLIFHCGMNFAQLEKYLDLILKTELIMVESNGPHVLFRTSRKGKRFLKAYKSLQALMK